MVILGLSFTLFDTFFFYFYNDFTIKASLLNLHTKERSLPFSVS
ncbi:hypothetical protein [Nostoc sp. PCC 7524]|nr:hypothetical protein [Nostoc sp. PCC 7524]